MFTEHDQLRDDQAQSLATASPPGGQPVTESASHVSRITELTPRSKHSAAVIAVRCSGFKRNGKPCGSTKTLPDPYTGEPRCRHHRAEAEQPTTPPVKAIRTKGDASRYTAWVLDMGGRNVFKAAQVTALLKAVAQWERVQQRAEQAIMDEFTSLIALLKRRQRVFDKAIDRLPEHEVERVTEGLADLDAEVQAGLARLDVLHVKQERANAA